MQLICGFSTVAGHRSASSSSWQCNLAMGNATVDSVRLHVNAAVQVGPWSNSGLWSRRGGVHTRTYHILRM